MECPTIRVEDWEEDPPLTLKYICGENEVDLETLYRNIKALSDHPGRGRLVLVSDSITPMGKLRLKECDEDFISTFWDCFVKILDYIADFLTHDTPAMQMVWFHLLDELQEAGKLPHQFWHTQVPSCSHAEQFSYHYEQTLQLINVVIMPASSRYSGLLARPNIALTLPSNVDLGSFKTGLKPWQQFLYDDSPGFDVPEIDKVYPQDIQQYLNDATSEQYVPKGGLAIIQKHTEKLRSLAAKDAQRDPSGPSEAEVSSRFDQHSIKLARTFVHTSIDGRESLVQPMYPNRTSSKIPRTYTGLGDPSMIERQPDLNLLDECVGNYKGSPAFVHHDWEQDFHMWHVSSALSRSSGPNIGEEEYLELFEEFGESA